MKRSRIERKKPFVSKTGLRRRKPMQRASASVQPGARSSLTRKAPMKTAAPKPAVPRKQRDRLRERAGEGEWCEIRQACCLGRGTDPSHRVSRKSGGRHGDAAVEAAQLSCLVWACRACHDLCHDRPLFAERMGWFVREGFDPRKEPVLIGGRKVLLGDDGSVTPYQEGEAA
ncbi:hypothetical protein ACQP1P_38780 [Dactylosporangium sp. CA-052675]|uniref:hypothetical protein n=1 Tax=Dactylosporangium sp. CA-052675 TaxID=3239927 RepID=UPI003D90E35F